MYLIDRIDHIEIFTSLVKCLGRYLDKITIQCSDFIIKLIFKYFC